MDFQIITESSGWLVLFCIAAGLLAAILLYRKNSSLGELSSRLVFLLAALRFLSVLLISFLILSPLIRTIFHEVEKPLVIFLQDGSSSVIAGADSSGKQKLVTASEDLLSGLGDDFEVRTFTIGDRVREGIEGDFKDKQTDLSAAVAELKSRFAGRNTGAVILSTDGLYNTGANPIYQYDQLNVPVYTIGLGDTTVRKDLLIGGLRYNRTVYKGNSFPVEITVDARRLMGQKAELKILKGEEEVYSKTIAIQSQRFNNLVTVFLDANEKGTIAYTVKLENLSGEVNYANNTSRFFVDVTENRQKVLIVYNSPHPDIALLYEVLESSKTYEVTSKPATEFDGNVSGFNLVILHQIPGTQSPGSGIIEASRNLGLPVWYILGAQTSVNIFNSLKAGVSIRDNRGNLGEVQADPSNDFTAFTFAEEQLRLIPGFPPLTIPFGTYTTEGETQVLLKQKIGQVKTGMPMLSYFQDGTARSAVLCGEGLWKWGLSEYAEYGNKNVTTAVILKTVQYLASGRKATPFRIFMKNDYAENEQVTADAELYNPSGELVNDPEVSVTFKHEDGRNFNFIFNRTGKSYTLNAGFLPSGRYRYAASVTLGKTMFNEAGGFTVSELLAEQAETVADHQLLRSISSKTGGAFFMPASMNAIGDSLRKSSIKPVSFERRKLDDLVNLKWYFVLAFSLLAIEWLLRKRSGIY